MGRYKFNKKLSLWQRVTGYKLVYPVADPSTGEILFDEGHLLSKEDARTLDTVGVGDVTIDVEGQPLRVMSNKMCDLQHYVDFDPLAECGIKLVGGVRGDVTEAVGGYLAGTLEANPNFSCNHHHEHGEGHSCGGHGHHHGEGRSCGGHCGNH